MMAGINFKREPQSPDQRLSDRRQRSLSANKKRDDREEQNSQQTNSRRFYEEDEYSSRLQNMRELYEMRFLTLQETIKNVYEKILNDELLLALREDETSRQFVDQRIQELFEEIVLSEREVIIDKLSSQYAFMKAEFARSEFEKRKEKEEKELISEESMRVISELKEELIKEKEKRVFFEQEYQRVERKLSELNDEFESAIGSKDQHMREQLQIQAEEQTMLSIRFGELEREFEIAQQQEIQMKQEHQAVKNQNEQQLVEISSLQLEIKTMNIELHTAEEKFKQSAKMNETLRQEVADVSARFTQLMQTNTHLTIELDNATQALISAENIHNSKMQAIQADFEKTKELFEKHKGKSKEKIDAYKKKIIEYKQRNQEGEAATRALNQESADEKERNLKHSKQWERILADTKAEYERKIAEIQDLSAIKLVGFQEEEKICDEENQARHEDYMEEMQNSWQDRLRNQVDEIRHDCECEMEEMREQERQLRGMLDEKFGNLKREYIERNIHENAVERLNQDKERLREEYEAMVETIRRENTQRVSQLEKTWKEHREEESAQFQKAIKELEHKQKQLEDQLKHSENQLQVSAGNARNIENERDGLSDKLKEQLQEKEKLQGKVAQLKTKLKDVEKINDSMSSSEKQLRAELDAAQQDRLRMREQLETTILKQQEASIASAQNSSMAAHHQAALTFKDEIISSLKSTIAEIKSEHAQLNSNYINLCQKQANKSVTNESTHKLKEEDIRRNEELRGELMRLTVQLTETNSQYDILKSSHNQVLQESTQLEEMMQNLKMELLDTERKWHESERSKLEGESQFKRQIQRIKERVRSAVTGQLKQLQAQLKQLQDFSKNQLAEELRRQSEEVRSREALFQDRISIVERDYEDQILEIKQQYEQELAEQLESKDREIRQLDDYSQKLNTVNQQLISESNLKQHELHEMSNQRDQLHTALSLAQDQLGNAVKKQETIQAACDERLQEMEKKLEGHKEKHKRISEREIELANEETKQWKNKYENLTESSQNQKDIEIARVQQSLSAVINELRQCEEREREATLRASQLEEELENWGRETRTLTEMELEFKAKEEEWRRVLRQIQDEKDSQMRQLEKEADRVSQLSAELSQTNSQLQVLKQINTQSQTNISSLNETLNTKNNEINELHKLLKHSLRSVSDSAQGADLAKKLDQETQILTKRVKDLHSINQFLNKSPSSQIVSPQGTYYNQRQAQNICGIAGVGGDQQSFQNQQVYSQPQQPMPPSPLNCSQSSKALQIGSYQCSSSQQPPNILADGASSSSFTPLPRQKSHTISTPNNSYGGIMSSHNNQINQATGSISQASKCNNNNNSGSSSNGNLQQGSKQFVYHMKQQYSAGMSQQSATPMQVANASQANNNNTDINNRYDWSASKPSLSNVTSFSPYANAIVKEQ